jgi:hypothetical protein
VVPEQPSKPCLPSREFYQSAAQNIPAIPTGIDLSDVWISIQAILKEPHCRPPPLEPSKSGVPQPPLTPPNRSLPPRDLSRSGLPSPATFSSVPKPVKGGWRKKALDTIAVVETEAREIGATLSFKENVLPDPASLRTLLGTASKGVESATKSLEDIKLQVKEVVDRKTEVMGLLRSVDSRISFLGRTLPPQPPDTTPVFFDAGATFECYCFTAAYNFFSAFLRKPSGEAGYHSSSNAAIGRCMSCHLGAQ